MKIVLFRSVDNLGAAGETVDVKRGYFRNYLGPRGFAAPATRANLALVESQRRKIEAMVARERSAATDAAKGLEGVALAFELRANERGQLFGSVGTIDIAKALAAKGHDVDRRKIELPEIIKTLGTFPVRIRLYPEVYASISVTVERLLSIAEREAIEEETARRAAEEERLKAQGRVDAEEIAAEEAEAAEAN
jgi:large subunit ribosomal protein L9